MRSIAAASAFVAISSIMCGQVGGTPALPSAQGVASGLSADRTDIQRNAFWETVKGKEVRWTIEVWEVTTGWFSGYKVRGMASPTLQVSCELEETPPMTSAVSQINKGDRVTCAGRLGKTFVVVFGIATVQVDGFVQR